MLSLVQRSSTSRYKRSACLAILAFLPTVIHSDKMFFSTLFIFAFMSIAGYAHAQYVLEDDYMSGGNFFDLFTFWDAPDPYVLVQS